MPNEIKNILISRVDSLGDVVLTLPMAGVIKALYPHSKIIFLGNNYTAALIRCTRHIDRFVAWDDIQRLAPDKQVEVLKSLGADLILHVFPRPAIAKLAYKAGIPVRVGTSRRLYHWIYCNRRVTLARRQSDFHESQLNLQLLTPFGARDHYRLSEIPGYYGLDNVEMLEAEFSAMLSDKRFNLILHPKSKGSAREWGLENFSRLIQILPKERYKIFITGTRKEGELIKVLLTAHKDKVVDLTGRFDLDGLIRFIRRADGIVAASTGPLHMASALGRYALGLYAPMRPIHPGRWAPVGEKADFLVIEKECRQCRKSSVCQCLRSITPEQVLHKLDDEYHKRNMP